MPDATAPVWCAAWCATVMREAARRLARSVRHRAQRYHARLDAVAASMRGSPRPPRVLATACWYFPIYSQTFVYQELCAMIDAGLELTFLYSAESTDVLPPQFARLGAHSRRLQLSRTAGLADLAHYRRRMPERVATILLELSQAANIPLQDLEHHEHVLHAFTFTRLVEAWQADYVHSYFFYERSLFTYIASRLLNLPRGVSCYADHQLQDYELKVVGLQLAAASVVVATSARIKGELEACAGGALPQALVKYNAVDTSRYVQRTSVVRPPAAPWRLVAVNRIDRKKGLGYLVEAIALLRTRGLAVELDLLGAADAHDASSQAHERELMDAVQASGLTGTIRMLGRQPGDAVRTALANCDIFVAPYVELPNGDKDGVPTALLEAMAAACAVVVTHAGSIAEVVTHDVDGLVVPQRDPEAIAEAIERLTADDTLRTRLSQAAAVRAREHFDVTTSERELHARIRAAVAARRDCGALPE